MEEIITDVFEVTFSFTETLEGGVAVIAKDAEDAASKVLKDFEQLPDLQILDITKAPDGKYDLPPEEVPGKLN